MPRRREVPKRQILPDPLYNSQLVTKFVNVVMRDGKKSVAEKLLYDALSLIQERTEEDPMKIFKKAVDNVKPVVEVKSRRVGGSTYQVPIEVRPSRQTARRGGNTFPKLTRSKPCGWILKSLRGLMTSNGGDRAFGAILSAMNISSNALASKVVIARRRLTTDRFPSANP